MSLLSLDQPDDPAMLAKWLESHLAGPDLPALAAELLVGMGKVPDDGRDSASWLGPTLDRVLTNGLSALSKDRVRELLKRPDLLLDLHEQVLCRGGDYWQQQINRHSGYEAPFERGLARLKAELFGARPTPVRVPFWIPPTVVALATAAVVLLAVFGVKQLRQSSAGDQLWGWNRTEALAQATSPKAYLEGLASSADEWFNKQPQTREDLARRINQMRAGCSKLILADHSVLSPPDRDFLIDRCRKWAARIDEQLTALEAGKEVKAVRGEMDEVVRRLATTLRDRAKSLA